VDYPDTGHALHWEEPARVGADIARFLARVADDAAGQARTHGLDERR
jgi:hypothetical protein